MILTVNILAGFFFSLMQKLLRHGNDVGWFPKWENVEAMEMWWGTQVYCLETAWHTSAGNLKDQI